MIGFIYIYINQYDENLLNIFLICCLKPSTDICKTYTYIYGKDPTVQNLPYTRELTFLNILFKNIYYTSVQFDLKELEKNSNYSSA